MAKVDYARREGALQILEAPWVLRANNSFWSLAEKNRSGRTLNYEGLLNDWKDWFEKSVRYV